MRTSRMSSNLQADRRRAGMIALVFVGCLLAGCAMVKPERGLEELTPIDWGLEGAFEDGVTVMPFTCRDAKWGAYAAERMQEHLLTHKAFRRVVLSHGEQPETPWVITGEIEQLYYGGTGSASRVGVSVRVIGLPDGQTRFQRISRMSSEKKAFHLTWLKRVYLRSPYPEELLNPLLGHIAWDIAERTSITSAAGPLTQ
ncbi:MAG: hypothetical protein WAR22_04545 [Desulfomonilia bacterium]|jgi:hypothetical protein